MSDETKNPIPVMPAGWYDDPTMLGEARYWDGFGWTTSINTNGVTATAAIDPSLVGTPPMRGTEFRAQRRAAPAPRAAPVTVTQSSQRSPLGAILAAVVVIILIVAVVMVLTRDNNETPDTPDVPATTPAAPATDAPPVDAPEADTPSETVGG
ncbi:DUF2510 domain-containing protein [Ilumatobacter sp.]|uniref:DUF2510 domain-containing protein n=1 Tax=Ilumatobacter sp. TaxID=1967498 RepID=UPI003C34A0E3